MAETTTVLSVIATTADRLSDLVISNGQLIFVRDSHKVAFDYDDTRTFYGHIAELDTEDDREALESPIDGTYYFVIGTACLWFYKDAIWTQITSEPESVIYLGTELPELGSENKVYINTSACEISVWDEDSGTFIVVANKSTEADEDEITALFNGVADGEIEDLFETATDDEIESLFK